MIYSDPIIKKYQDLIKAANPEIKAYYQGEPFKIGVSELPAIFIRKTTTQATNFTNAEDMHQAQHRLTVVTDIRQELSTSEDERNIVAGIARLYELMEGRDSDYKLKTNTILHILRTNVGVDTSNNLRTDLSTGTTIDYNDTINFRAGSGWFVEAHIDFMAEKIQTR